MPGYKEWAAFMDKYYPDGDKTDAFTVYGYTVAQTLVQVLKQCGDDLTRENIMKQAASLKDLALPMLLPGIKINTSADRLLPDRADADGALRRRALGAVRPGHHRRRSSPDRSGPPRGRGLNSRSRSIATSGLSAGGIG